LRASYLRIAGRTVPRLSEFYGIVIAMYYRDHAPPHFHAIYGDWDASVAIESVELLDGNLPTRAWHLVREWAEMHQSELLLNWERARLQQPLKTIDPLQ
jgi:hypothetical protein